MSPEQLATEMAEEQRLEIARRIVARCTGCAFGFISFREGLECYRCGDLVERVSRETLA